MASLYEIDRDIEQVLTNGFVFNEETGEVDTFLTQDVLEQMLDYKFEDYGLYIKHLKSDANAIDNEIKNLQKRKQAKIKLSERLSATLVTYMLKHDKKRLETPRIDIRTRKSQRLIIDDEEALVEACKAMHKDDCYTINIVQRVNKLNIKKQIEDFDGMGLAHIENNTTVNIK